LHVGSTGGAGASLLEELFLEASDVLEAEPEELEAETGWAGGMKGSPFTGSNR
jgi:hypothetical protein